MSAVELHLLKQVPAVFVNGAAVTVGDGVVRLAFSENLGPDDPPTFRVAVVMPTEAAQRILLHVASAIAEAARAQQTVVAPPDDPERSAPR